MLGHLAPAQHGADRLADCCRATQLARPLNPERRDKEDLLSSAITLDDAKPLFLEYQAAGVVFHQTLRTEPWGARTFIVRDPDGNLTLFAGRAG